MDSWWIVVLLALPALAAIATSACAPDRAGLLASRASAATFLLAIAFALFGQRGIFSFGPWVEGLGIGLALRADAFTLTLALLVSGIGTAVLHYSAAYFGAGQTGRRALAWLLAFQASMLGLVFSDNALLLFVFWELTGISSFFLIQLESARSRDAEPASRQALLVTALGGLPLLVGLLLLQAETGTASVSAWASASLDARTANLAFVLVAIGALAKSAQFPFHFWLPGAMAAPSPISAYLHSATLVKAGVILLLMLFPLLHTAPLWTPLLLTAGLITCVWGSYRSLAERDIKSLMAWSTVSQLGLLVLTLGLGTELAARAAILHLFAHAVFKACLFLVVGSVDKSTGTRDLRALGGVARREPLLAVAAIIAAGSMAGLPPLAGFLSKELILKKTMLADPAVHVPALVGIVVGSIGTVVYSTRFVVGVFFGRARSSSSDVAPDAGPEVARDDRPRLRAGLLAAPLALAGFTLVAGLGVRWTDSYFLEPATAALLGHALEPPQLRLWYGWNVPLFLSLGILTVGLGLHRVSRGRLLPLGSGSIAPHRLFASLLAAAERLGASMDRRLARGDVRVHIALPLVVGFMGAWSLLPSIAAPGRDGIDLQGLVVTGGLLVAALRLLRARERLEKIVCSSIIGFGVALLFRRANAPDLVLTQLLVELIVTVVLLLGIRGLSRPGTAGPDPSSGPAGPTAPGRATRSAEGVAARDTSRVRGGASPGVLLRHGAALGVAAGAALLVLVFGAQERSTRLKDFYAWAGPELAQGKNLVNVILVDFRALDTFVEVAVVLLAGLGALALFRHSEGGPAVVPSGALAPSGPLLRTVSILLVPFSLLLAFAFFLRGHDDPGGGFVASLVVVLGWVLFALSRGDRAIRDHGRSARAAAFGGVVVLLCSAVLPLTFGEPALRQAGTTLLADTPWRWKTHSALIFDLGVVLTVAGASVAALLALLSGGRR